MDQKTLKLNYCKQATAAIQKLITLPITDEDEDKTLKAVLDLLNRICTEYGG